VGQLRAIGRISKSWVKRALTQTLSPKSGQGKGIPAEHWGLSGSGGNLYLNGIGLGDLAAQHGSPLHVVNAERLRDNARRYQAAPQGRKTGCEVFYSYKTNPIPGVLRELHASGIGAEVISPYELWLALELGVSPDKIVYNGPAKSEASIRRAIGLGIQLLNINHPEELPVVARIARELGRKPRVGMRVTTSGWAGQFGVSATDGQAVSLYEEAMRAGCLDVVGLHVHRGGMIRSFEDLIQYVDGVLAFVDVLQSRLGLRLEILDLGGSLGSPSVRGLSERELRLNRTFFREIEPPDPKGTLHIDGYVTELLARIDTHYARSGEQAPRIFVEPGRSMTSDTQLLLAKVLSLKADRDRTHAILDVGINLAESCRSEYHQVLPLTQRQPGETRVYTLVGPICTPADCLRWAVRLPELRVGDTLAFMDAGAYFVPFSTSFSFPQPAVVMVDGGRVQALRRAETFDDLVSYDLRPDGDQGPGPNHEATATA
jgi:diaminopimelate decarboxylase